MRKIFKKIISLSLSVLIMMSVLAACGETPTLLPFIAGNLQDLNFGGFEFELGDTISSEEGSIMSYKLNTNLSDLALKRFSDIEETYDCTIDRNYLSIKGTFLAQQIIASACKYDFLYVGHESGQQLAKGKALIPAYDYMSYIDLNNYDKFGTPSVQEANAYKGEIYLFSPHSWLYHQPASLDILVFNMDYVERYGKRNPHEYIENEAWNWDAFEDVVSDYYVNEGTKEVFSLACRCFDVLKLLCLGNGVNFTYVSDDGTLKSDFGQSNMLGAIEFYNRIFNENEEKLALPITGNMDWGDVDRSFIDDRSSMVCLTSPTMLYNSIAYEVENYTVMPFPTGPSGEYGKWPSIIESSDGFAVPTNCREPESIFKIIDMICEPLDGYETEDLRVEFLAENVVYDEYDAKIALTAHLNGSYSYWKADVGTFGPDLLWRKLAESHNSSRTSKILGQYEDKFNLSVQEYMTPNLELVKYFE